MGEKGDKNDVDGVTSGVDNDERKDKMSVDEKDISQGKHVKGGGSSLPTIGGSTSKSARVNDSDRDRNSNVGDSMLPMISVGNVASNDSKQDVNPMLKHAVSHSSSNLSSKKSYGYTHGSYQSRRKEKKSRRKDGRKDDRRRHRARKKSDRKYSKKSYGQYGSSSSYKSSSMQSGGGSTRRSHNPSHSFSVLGQGQSSGAYPYYGSSKKRNQKYHSSYPSSYASSVGASPLRKLGV